MQPLLPVDEPDELPEPLLFDPPELEEVPPKVVPPPEEPALEAHALSQAVHAVTPASPWVERQLDSPSFEEQVSDWAFGALKLPPGQMQPR